jgi:uncharacterized membrane protein YgcG
MLRPVIAAFIISAVLGSVPAGAQQTASYKGFTTFKNVVPDIDFYASNRQAIAAYEKPAGETIEKLKTLFGQNLPKGAIFVCSSLEQKDAVYEPKVLKMGYGWSLTIVTTAVRAQEMLARIKSQMGDDIPAEIKERIQRMQPEMMATQEKQTVANMSQQLAYAITRTMFAKDLQYRSSRLDDMGKSPLPDWLDIGIAAYASGVNSNLSFLQQNMDQTFPIEDVLSMSRPFMASSGQNGNGGGRGRTGGGEGSQSFSQGNFGGRGTGGFPGGNMGGFPGGNMGGFPGGGTGGFPGGGTGGFPGGGMGGAGQGSMGGSNRQGGQRGGMPREIPKDEQDRMLFDGQSSTFFSFMLNRVGIAKMQELIKQVLEGKETREYITKPDVLGEDFEKIEADWVAWVKTLKP